ncbi:hypothetical protein SpCBS45565_g00845 [Spizellomyces sp. 'palustris']|nr:hypothetical protein SpCBS45565_g00845 [Spizellomyces sp. 'palustris']
MFDHGYQNYMRHAYPLDELNPLACNGRTKDGDPGNWNVNDVLGNFSLTLVDSLDAHAIMRDQPEFEKAVRLVIDHVHFEQDSRVQVFEVTIRVLGALLSAHILATEEKWGSRIAWYNGELLALAQELADRLMPAFNTPTGMPWPRVNLKYGVLPHETEVTCSAGAGTLILEFGVLTRLTGNAAYENAAKKALLRVWAQRSPLDLVGNSLSVKDAKWYNTMAGIGAGIDSFYEYLLKAYILFGEYVYLDIFDAAYKGLMNAVKDERGLIYRNVDMFSGALAATWVDSLAAFFPGLQVLAGDIENAIKLHQVYYTIWRRYRSLPERFDFQTRAPAIAVYPLRPELIESTYMLYQATKDPYYLEVGEQIVMDLEESTRVQCGFAALADVVKGELDDRMESFFLSETLKYLYLLFDEENFVNVNDGNHVFTTEGHFLSLSYDLLKHESDTRGPDNSTRPPRPSSQPVCDRYMPIHNSNATSYYLPVEHSPPLPQDEIIFIKHLIGGIQVGGDAPTDADEYIKRLVNSPDNPPPLQMRPFEFKYGLRAVLDAFLGVVLLGAVMFSGHRVEPHDGSVYQSARIVKSADGFIADHFAGLQFQVERDPTGAGYRVTKMNGMDVQPTDTIKVPQQGISFLTGPAKGDPLQPSQSHDTGISHQGARLEAHLHDDNGGFLQRDIMLAIAQFGPQMVPGEVINTSLVVLENEVNVEYGCHPFSPEDSRVIQGRLVFVRRGGCLFAEKAIWAELAGAIGVVVMNQIDPFIFPMASGAEQGLDGPGLSNGVDIISIPAYMVSGRDGALLVREASKHGPVQVRLRALDGIEAIGAVDMQIQFAGRPVLNVMVVQEVREGHTSREMKGPPWRRWGTRGSGLLDPGTGFGCLIGCGRAATQTCCSDVRL